MLAFRCWPFGISKRPASKGQHDAGLLGIQREALFDFVQEFKNLNISQDKEILVICASGERSQISAELLSRENYKSANISDGFMGSQESIGWKNCGLPFKT